MILSTWQFALNQPGKEEDFISSGVEGETVTVPHTWNVSQLYQSYTGAAWYSTDLLLDKVQEINLLRFEAVYHDAAVYVNGQLACTHKNAGYTPFETDITKYVKCGKNLITVWCSNAFSTESLPYNKDYDWANDGGIIRPVSFVQKKKDAVRECRIVPEVTAYQTDEKCSAAIHLEVMLYTDSCRDIPLSIEDGDGQTVYKDTMRLVNGKCTLQVFMEHAVLWSPGKPYLYTLLLDGAQYRFGIRTIQVKGNKIIFNGKETKLIGIEWMPGSHPDYGMAEPPEVAIRFLQLLKDANCNFTRFHWQQPDFVYDWCDENGLMVQEEIPYWGCPKAADRQRHQVARHQAEEMVRAHQNHPSIICWGVGNELNGRHKATVAYVKELVAYFKSLDNSRLVNYVSNTLGQEGSRFFNFIFPSRPDATVYGDICMWNEYMGTWYGKCNYDKKMQYVCEQTKGKPFMVTEFGLCEPAFKGGDPKRIAIYNEKTALYKKYNLNGWIYFSLNDYRTHLGEDGSGRLKQRVHGSTDLRGRRKPSYSIMQQQIKNDLE